MSVLREIPFSGRFHRPRVRDFTFEESMDRTRDPLILWHERARFSHPGYCDWVVYTWCSTANLASWTLNISMIRNFVDHRENWTQGSMEDYVDSERNFAKKLIHFAVLCQKRNIDWREGGKPPY